MMEKHYPTAEQAAAAAMVASEIGDWVTVHEASCRCESKPEVSLDEACTCHPLVMGLTVEGWRFGKLAEDLGPW